MNILSLFDGISCGRLALQRAGLEVSSYYASEIDKDAIKISKANWPDILQVGDVTQLRGSVLPSIDLLIGGSPCQSISTLGDGTGLKGKSALFWEYLRLKEEVNPRYWLLENVSGSKGAIKEISEALGVEPIKINSSLLSAQKRERLYWTNIGGIEQPDDVGLSLLDILEPELPELAILSEARLRWLNSVSGANCLSKRYAVLDPIKANCLTARSDCSWNSNYVTRDGQITRLTPTEYERLQTLPDGYTNAVSTTARYKSIGNGWTVDVIAHILSNIKVV